MGFAVQYLPSSHTLFPKGTHSVQHVHPLIPVLQISHVRVLPWQKVLHDFSGRPEIIFIFIWF